MSTYSPSLRIELITTGDQAGTWGNTTNTNMGTLIESAIAGYTSVSITSVNQALSALNGAADESRNMTIALTTTTTANFNVYAPPAEKTYILYNTTAYTATIYNWDSSVYPSTLQPASGGTGLGVSIPAGKTVTVWSDGTNFALQTTSVPTAASNSNDTTPASTAFVQAVVQALHPIGSIYINATNSTNPATLLGFGTWVAFGAGRVPVGFDAGNPLFDTAEETGGSYNATLPSHTHTWSGSSSGSVGSTDLSHTHTWSGYGSGTTSVAGADHTHTYSGFTNILGSHVHGVRGAYYSPNSKGIAEPGSRSIMASDNATNLAYYSILQSSDYILSSEGAHQHYFSGTTATANSNHTHNVGITMSGTTSGASVSMNHNHSVSVSTTGSNSTEGASATNANIQPYITVYMWKRTA